MIELGIMRPGKMFTHDPLDVGVFDPSIQGNTSKFLVLYRKQAILDGSTTFHDQE